MVKGATSFQDMATIDGVVYESFQAACLARGMMADDSDLIEALHEIVSTTVSVCHIRRLFARMLVHGAPSDPQALFYMFADDLSDAADGSDGTIAALLAIESIMLEMGRSLTDADFGFELPEAPYVQPQQRRRRVANGTSAPEAQLLCDSLLPQFTDEQRAALHQVTEAIASGQHCKVFALLASAGCGKTLFANGIAAYLRAQGLKVMCVAASALAAMLLTGGTTAHSALHIPIPCHESSTCNLSGADRIALRHTALIIYDECSMVHEDVAGAVDRTLRDVMGNTLPFGGKCVMFMGDFKQLLPVVRYGKGHNFTMHKCHWWSQVTRLNFTKNWRAATNPAYTQWLEDVGAGRIEDVVVPDTQRLATYAELIDTVYGPACQRTDDRMLLALTLETCASVNQMCFAKLPGAKIDMPAADSYVDCSDRDAFPPDYVESVPMKGAPPYLIQLAVGAKYMCIKNIDVQRGIINGTMLRLISIGRRVLQFQIVSGRSTGSIESLTKVMFTITPEASGLPFTILRRQFPIIPAYCLSVHKAQGQSLLEVGIIFESDPFTHGQLYVAFSRVGSFESAFVCHQGDNIRNKVLKHLLQ